MFILSTKTFAPLGNKSADNLSWQNALFRISGISNLGGALHKKKAGIKEKESERGEKCLIRRV